MSIKDRIIAQYETAGLAAADARAFAEQFIEALLKEPVGTLWRLGNMPTDLAIRKIAPKRLAVA